jgi:hypothetical protein
VPVAPNVVAAPPRLALVLGILRAAASMRRGAKLRLTVLTTESGSAELTVTRKGRAVGRIARTVSAGRFTLLLAPRMALGRYRFRLALRNADGRSAMDAVWVRVVKRR